MGSLYRTLTGQSQKSHKSDGSGSGSGSARPVLTRDTTTDPLSGVLNHLNESQAKRLDEFKALLQKEGWWTPESLNGKPSHDDGTLLRYLRARKFDVKGAYGQFTDTEKWLKEQRVEELYEHFDVEHYEKARVMYPQWTGHRDRRGIPIYVFVIRGLDSKNVSKYQKESQTYKDSLPTHKKLATPSKLLPLFALYHNLLNFVLPLVSTLERPNPEVPVTNSTNIVDITGVGLTQFWNLKGHMQDASVLATAHYPETLDRIFIIGAPAFFPTVWGWIKRWFDPVTVSKIFILSKNEVKPTLEKFMDPKDFPKRYGGELEWEWGQLPHLDDETREALERDGNEGWVRGPSLWLNHQRVVVGSENGKLRRSDADIMKMKPVVYAADGTEVPVHPEAKDTTALNGALIAPNGAIVPPAPAHRTSSHAITAAEAATVVEATAEAVERRKSESAPQPISTPTASDAEPASVPAPPTTTTETKPPAPEINQENVRAAPIDGAPLNLPEKQPGFPEQTAEYIHPDNAAHRNGEPRSNPEPKPAPAPTHPTSAPTSAPLTNGDSTASAPPTTTSSSPPPPPAQPLPGPPTQHTIEVTKAISDKLSGESTSSIPATANGSANGNIPHPEVIVSSDRTKGLAVEADKLDRPGMERFITATEIPEETKA